MTPLRSGRYLKFDEEQAVTRRDELELLRGDDDDDSRSSTVTPTAAAAAGWPADLQLAKELVRRL
eukprot:COSAG01_NODE_174_length_23022_cov_528.590978_7_plen_65_part_00